ncbi:uro-adherence factor A-like isoform X3 [Eurosta solidaginis]|uniref:uro-adherence factor A-like isoform X3 n=1 Tax=Eurosta solidaginis TaxID=178769 RepID=UPI0035313479
MTVQTSWRPQLPLPTKEPDADSSSTTDEQDVNDMEQRAQHQHVNSCKDNNSLNATHTSSMNHTPASATKKWSFGRLFRRKKDIASDSSSEEDRKAGFTPTHRNSRATSGSSANLKTKLNKTNKLSRSSKLNGASFDHIVLHPQTGAPITPPHPPVPHVDNEFFLPVETISPSGAYYQNQQQYLQQGAQAASALDRRAAHAVYKTRSAQRLPHDSAMLGAPPRSSSEEEIISLNSSTFSKYRSDESIHSGGQANNMQSKRSRAARNERYYKRLSRDGEPSTGQVPLMYAPQQTQRWKTQPVPLSIYNPSAAQVALAHNPQTATPRLRNTSSLQHVAPYVQWGQLQQQQQQQQSKNLQNSMNDAKRSISYDSHIHLQNINGRLQTKPLPPPPPPRDPLRRVNVIGQMQNGSSAGDLRPISYAFDQSGLPLVPSTNRRLGNRCVSDDKIWSGPAGPHYQSVHSLNTPLVSAQHEQQQAAHQAGGTPHHRRFITRAERDAHPGKKSLPNGLEFHYVADATPRSRKPIHMLEPQYDGAGKEESGAGILRTTKSGLASPSTPRGANDFWQRMDTNVAQQQRGRTTHAAEVHAYPRSISSSRVGELRAYPIPLYSEVQKPKREPQASPFSASGVDEVDNIVCGSLHIKSKPDTANANYVEIRNKDYSKSNSMPNQYQRRSGEIPNTQNKYDEYVAEKREQHHKPIYGTPTPPQRKLSITPSKAPELPIYLPRKKPANLEEAINELEAIYKSLGLTEPEPEPEKKQRVPTPSEFEKYALARAAEFDDDEDSPAGEPDPIRDDVAYRNMQLANLQHKTAEKQPPFGIPVGPVVAAPHTDYLHVTPIVEPPHRHAPDIVKDDLAVRALRKDPPVPKDKFNYPYSSFQQQKKNRATRTQSANIYNLIHRDAAKPSGGDLHSYLELTRNLERAGSMSDLHHKGDKDIGVRASDVPATLALLRNLKEQEQELATPAKKAPIPFRHPSQGGAICALPEKLPSHSAMNKQEVHKPPVPLPRKSLTPEPTAVNAQMEDALNKIAKEAQEKSMKLTKELQELRKEALITSARSKASANAKMNSTEEERLEQDLQEIEAVSEAAKRCGKMLLDTLPDTNEPHVQAKPRKLQKEGKLIEAIDQVSEAANAVCEKILKDIVTTEPPVVLQEAVKVKNKQGATTAMPEALVTPNLIKKLDPIQSEKIEAIAKRCMRQLSELAEDNPDYDNLNQELKERQQEQEEREQSNAAISAAHAKPANSCNAVHIQTQKVDNSVSTVPEAARTQTAAVKSKQNVEEIDQIMQECEAKMRAGSTYTPTVAPPPLPLPAPVVNANVVAMRHLSSSDDHTTAPSIATTTNSSCSSAAAGSVAGKTGTSTTASSFSSSSDCLAKSSSPSAGRRQSSSITSFNPYSSSDYIKSPTSSDYHTPSTDPIKTFSTTSYDVQTTTSAATPNISATTNSTFSYTPSPPPPPKLILMVDNESAGVARSGADSVGSDASCGAVVSHTAIATRQSQERQRARSLSTPSQYNSSEELAMIFGIDEQTCRLRSAPQATSEAPPSNVTGKIDVRKTNHAIAPPPVPLLSSNHTYALSTTMLVAANATSNSNASQLTTNPQAVDVGLEAHECVEPANSNTNRSKRLRNAIVVDSDVHNVVDVSDDVTSPPSSSTISINHPTIISSFIRNSCSSLSLSPNSCKLESIPESQAENASKKGTLHLKLSPNFNQIYASKISIVVDNATEQCPRIARLTQCDSMSSCEDETSSNPDSGNVSLADFPLSAQTNNASLQLENACNSRFEIKKKCFLNEVCIERRVEHEFETSHTQEGKEITVFEEFPPPPSEKELLYSLVDEIVNKAVDEINQRVEVQNTREEKERECLREETIKSEQRVALAANTMESAKFLDSDNPNLNARVCIPELKESENEQIRESNSVNEINAGSKLQNLKEISSICNKSNESAQREQCSKLISNHTQTSVTDGVLCELSQNNVAVIQKSNPADEVDQDHLIELAQLVRSSVSLRNSAYTTEMNSAEAPESMPCTTATTIHDKASNISARIHTDLEHLRLAFNELLERNLNENDELPRIVEEEEGGEDEEQLEEIENNTSTEILSAAQPRKQSIVIETPPLNLNISEVKISYSTSGESESENILCDNLVQSAKTSADVKQHSATFNQASQQSAEHKGAACMRSQIIPWQRRSKNNLINDDNETCDNYQRADEKPSTSAAAASAVQSPQKNSRVLSVFGELRPVAAAAATDGLTTLEHVLLACSLGVITPTDLYTLCLIIVGMITLIAIVLF